MQLSEGGLLAATNLRLAIGDHITIHFAIHGQFLRARAEVVYIQPRDLEGRSRIGFKFDRLFDEYRTVIRNFVR